VERIYEGSKGEGFGMKKKESGYVSQYYLDYDEAKRRSKRKNLKERMREAAKTGEYPELPFDKYIKEKNTQPDGSFICPIVSGCYDVSSSLLRGMARRRIYKLRKKNTKRAKTEVKNLTKAFSMDKQDVTYGPWWRECIMWRVAHRIRWWFEFKWIEIKSRYERYVSQPISLCVYLLRLAFYGLLRKICIIDSGFEESKGGHKYYTVQFSHLPMSKKDVSRLVIDKKEKTKELGAIYDEIKKLQEKQND